jgi:probable F420-dependent oxidoreductase
MGFDSIWTGEQPVLPVETEIDIPRLWGDIPDPLIQLARASAVTKTLLLGTAVAVVTERHPVTFAKEVASLDMYSGGRVLLGIGTGSHKEEAAIFGSDFPHRWTQAREAVGALKELWTKEVSEWHGEYYDFPPVYCFPKPVQKPHPPLLFGSHVPRVFKRIVEYGDGWIPIGRPPAEIAEARAKLNALAEAAGRDPAAITITCTDVPIDREVIAAYRQAGADRVVLSLDNADKETSFKQLEKIAREAGVGD